MRKEKKKEKKRKKGRKKKRRKEKNSLYYENAVIQKKTNGKQQKAEKPVRSIYRESKMETHAKGQETTTLHINKTKTSPHSERLHAPFCTSSPLLSSPLSPLLSSLSSPLAPVIMITMITMITMINITTDTTLHARDAHGCVAQRQHHQERQNAAWDATRDKVLDLQITLARRVLLHDRRHVGEAARGQTHSRTAHEHASHDQQVRVRLLHVRTDVGDKGQQDQRSNRVADERGDDQDQRREDNQHPVKAHALDLRRNAGRDRVQQARRLDGLAQGKTAGGQDNDGPREVVKVFLGQNADAKEEHNGEDGNNTHVAKGVLELVARTPQANRSQRHNCHEPLDAVETLTDGADGYNGGAAAGAEG